MKMELFAFSLALCLLHSGYGSVITSSLEYSNIIPRNIGCNQPKSLTSKSGCLKAEFLEAQLLCTSKPKIRYRVWLSVKGKGSSIKAIECGDVFLDPHSTCREVKHALSHLTNCPVSAMEVILRDSDDEKVCTLGLRGERLCDHWAQPGGCLQVVQELPVTSVGWLEV